MVDDMEISLGRHLRCDKLALDARYDCESCHGKIGRYDNPCDVCGLTYVPESSTARLYAFTDAEINMIIDRLHETVTTEPPGSSRLHSVYLDLVAMRHRDEPEAGTDMRTRVVQREIEIERLVTDRVVENAHLIADGPHDQHVHGSIVHKTPMTPTDLSDAVLEIVRKAQARVGPGSIGAEQYHVDGQPQKFETMPLAKLAEYMQEESLDLVNYGTMMSIRAERLKRIAEVAESLVDEVNA